MTYCFLVWRPLTTRCLLEAEEAGHAASSVTQRNVWLQCLRYRGGGTSLELSLLNDIPGQIHFRVWFRETMVPVVATVHVVLSSKLTLLEFYAVNKSLSNPRKVSASKPANGNTLVHSFSCSAVWKQPCYLRRAWLWRLIRPWLYTVTPKRWPCSLQIASFAFVVKLTPMHVQANI